jgi:tetratricopeptide (TPR) repeat protein
MHAERTVDLHPREPRRIVNGEHYEEYELLAYLDFNGEMVDIAGASRHLSSCEDCGRRLESLRVFTALLSDKDIWRHAFGHRPRSGGTNLRDGMARLNRDHENDLRGKGDFAAIEARPVAEWPAYLAEHPEARNPGFLRRCIEQARREHNERPREALEILGFAKGVTLSLTDGLEIAELRGAIEKERSNALRLLGRYPEALEALDAAEHFFDRLPAPAYDLNFLDWSRATVLFYMTRYGEALALAMRVFDTFRQLGEKDQAQRSRILIASILCEQGSVHDAHAMYRDILAYFEARQDIELIAQLNANLAECEVRLDHPDDALRFAANAMRGYEGLGKGTERVRLRWTLGYQLLRRDHLEAALGVLQAASEEFESLGMVAEAGGVGLDLVEIHMRRKEWDQAEALSRHLVSVFSKAEARIHQVRALMFLRGSVEARTATVELLDYLRFYMSCDDQNFVFDPPE